MTRIRQGMTGKWNTAEYDSSTAEYDWKTAEYDSNTAEHDWNTAEYDSHTTVHDGKVEYGGI
jgi:hypothetical protein